MCLRSQVLVSEVCSLDYTPKLVWKAELCEDARRGSEIPNSFIPAIISLVAICRVCLVVAVHFLKGFSENFEKNVISTKNTTERGF